MWGQRSSYHSASRVDEMNPGLLVGSKGIQVRSSMLRSWSSGRDVVLTLAFLTLRSPTAPYFPKEGQ